MSENGNDLAQRIADRGHDVVLERLRAAFVHQAATRRGPQLDPARLEQMVQDAAGRAGGALWRRALAQAAVGELGVSLSDALHHPAVSRAHEIAGAPAWTPEAGAPVQPAPSEQMAPTVAQPPDVAAPDQTEPLVPVDGEPAALRLGAVHLTGIETLRPGDRDIELRLSDAGLDVLKRSTGGAIGRLEWAEIQTIELPAPRRGLRARRKFRELHVSTGRGQAQFELPGLTEDELRDHVEPMLERLRAANQPNSS